MSMYVRRVVRHAKFLLGGDVAEEGDALAEEGDGSVDDRDHDRQAVRLGVIATFMSVFGGRHAT